MTEKTVLEHEDAFDGHKEVIVLDAGSQSVVGLDFCHCAGHVLFALDETYAVDRFLANVFAASHHHFR